VPAITVFLIKAGLTNHYDIIDDVDGRPVIPIQNGRTLLGRLYIEPSRLRPPKWLSYFGGNEELLDLKLMSASASAVLLVQRDVRVFALVFGYGRYMLQEGVAESRFGLRVALNSVQPDQLRSIDHKRLDAVPRLTREQLSKGAGMEQFGLNIERDMLRALTGKPTDKALGSLLSGADQLAVSGGPSLKDVPESLDRYLVLSKKKTYREEFAWVDNITEVADPSIRSSLDEALVEQATTDSEAPIWLSAPDLIDWGTGPQFQYATGKSADSFDDLDIADYFEQQDFLKELTPDQLRSDRVFLVDSETSSISSSWSVYHCLLAEIELGKQRFVLNEGKWYEIDPTFLAEVGNTISKIPASKAPLPKATLGETEPAYHKRAFSTGGDAFALLDTKLIRSPGRGQVEVCDLYWAHRAFIHVKRYGASSALSHLFSQGAVSAQLFQSDPRFRAEFAKKLPKTHLWGAASDPVRTQDFEVGYAIIMKGAKPLNLPFFSKVNLKNAASLLRSFGYRVTLTAIHA